MNSITFFLPEKNAAKTHGFDHLFLAEQKTLWKQMNSIAFFLPTKKTLKKQRENNDFWCFRGSRRKHIGNFAIGGLAYGHAHQLSGYAFMFLEGPNAV